MTHAAELFRLDGKVAVVTGGSHGLGLHAAEGFAEMGASVVICARDADRLAAATQRLEAGRHRCLAISCDVSREEDVLALAARVESEFGRAG